MLIARSCTTSLLSLAIGSSAAWADTSPVAQRADVTLAVANQLLDATLAACHADGRTGVAAVVDRGGNLVAVQRDDNVGPHNTLAAQRKAFTPYQQRPLQACYQSVHAVTPKLKT